MGTTETMHTLPAPPFKGMGKLIHIAAWAILFGLPFFFTGRESQTVTVLTFGGALACNLLVFPQECGQLQHLQMMGEQDLRGLGHAASPDSRDM